MLTAFQRFWRRGRVPVTPAATMPARPDGPTLPPLAAPDWTASHRDDWRRFLGTATGQVLLQRVLAVEYVALLKAARQSDPVAMHRAAGWGELRAYLESLLQAGVVPESQTTQNAGGPEGEAGIRERFTP